jgi:hypothetical protein
LAAKDRKVETWEIDENSGENIIYAIILEKLMKNWIELVYLFGGCYLVAIPQLQFHCPFFQACHFVFDRPQDPS